MIIIKTAFTRVFQRKKCSNCRVERLTQGLWGSPLYQNTSPSSQWVSSILSLFASLNYKAFGNLFCNSQKSFHTSLGPYDSNNRGYRSFFKLSNGIYKKILRLGFFVNANVIVELEE